MTDVRQDIPKLFQKRNKIRIVLGRKVRLSKPMKNVKATFYKIRKLPDFNGRCKHFKMKCDSVPLTVKLADLWFGYKEEALDCSLEDVPGRRTVLFSELTNKLEKCERKGVINRRRR
jgi:hypothetical protein